MARRPRRPAVLLGKDVVFPIDSGPARLVDFCVADGNTMVEVEELNGDHQRLALAEVVELLACMPTVGGDAPAKTQEETWLGVSLEQRMKAEQRARDLTEMCCGDPLGDPRTRRPRDGVPVNPWYDPQRVTEAERVRRKAEDLRRRGETGCGSSTLRRQLTLLAEGGAATLVHGNAGLTREPVAAAPPALIDGIDRYVELQRDQSTVDWKAHLLKLRHHLHGLGIDELPGDDGLEVLLRARGQGRGLTAAATTRRSKAARPRRAQGRWSNGTPYETIELDSTPLDIYCLDQYGELQRVTHLLFAVDALTRRVVGMRLVAGHHPYNAREVCGLMWQVLRGAAYPGLYGRMRCPRIPDNIVVRDVDLNAVGTVTIDRGAQYNSVQTLGALRRCGAHVTLADPGTGWQKPHVESIFHTFMTLIQPWPGYTGANVQDRGRHPEKGPLLLAEDIMTLLWRVNDLYDARPHSDLVHPDYPNLRLSPRDREALYLRTGGRICVGADPSLALEMLKVTTQALHPEGIRLNKRWYDGKELSDLREHGQGEKDSRGTKVVTYSDDRDLSHVFVRLPGTGDVVAVFDKTVGQPVAPLHDQLSRDIRELHYTRHLTGPDTSRAELRAVEAEIHRDAQALAVMPGAPARPGRRQTVTRMPAAEPADMAALLTDLAASAETG